MQTTSVSSSSPRRSQVLEQGRDRPGPSGGTRTSLSRAASLDVAVPAGVGRRLVGAAIPVDLHQPDPRLDQPAGQQHPLAERGLARSGRGSPRAPRSRRNARRACERAEQVERLAGLRRRRVAAVGSRSRASSRRWRRSSRSRRRPQPVRVEVGGQVDLLDAVSLGRQPGVQEPGVGGAAEEARVLARPDAPVGVEDPVRERDRRRAARPGAGPTRPSRAPRLGQSFGGAGVGVLEVHRLVRPAREHVVAAGRVGVVARGDGPQDAELVGHQRRARQQLARSTGRGRVVAIGPNSPRTSAGASGLGSQVECWGGPPIRNRTMHDFARPNDEAAREPTPVRARSGRLSPAPKAEPADAEDLAAAPAVAEPGPGPRSRSIGPRLAWEGSVRACKLKNSC